MGKQTQTCLTSGQWSGAPITCEEKSRKILNFKKRDFDNNYTQENAKKVFIYTEISSRGRNVLKTYFFVPSIKSNDKLWF